MKPNHQLPTEGRSSRAAKAVKASMAHLPGGRPQAPFAGQGMNQGNTVPPSLPTLTPPAKGASNPVKVSPMQVPGTGATNPLQRKVKS